MDRNTMRIHSVVTGSNKESRRGNRVQSPSTFNMNKQSKSPSPITFTSYSLVEIKLVYPYMDYLSQYPEGT